ncbi:MAG: bifunctional folylpolyglutamate synthase/dihydrofolate synthase, partial [Candidatus Promineifilaceae bacterium]
MSSRYQETLDYLYGLVNFEHRRLDQYMAEKITLDRPRRLLALLGDPQDQFEAIHIAGTKGKGSVAAMSAAMLRAAGYRVGLYTSPHLFDFRDRIR